MTELSKGAIQSAAINAVESMQIEIDMLTEENKRLERVIFALREGAEGMRKLYGATMLKLISLKDENKALKQRIARLETRGMKALRVESGASDEPYSWKGKIE